MCVVQILRRSIAPGNMSQTYVLNARKDSCNGQETNCHGTYMYYMRERTDGALARENAAGDAGRENDAKNAPHSVVRMMDRIERIGVMINLFDSPLTHRI